LNVTVSSCHQRPQRINDEGKESMSQRAEHLILSASIDGLGFHPGAARAARPERLIELDHYRRLVQTAERSLLDFVLLYDPRALAAGQTFGRIDALSVLSRLAPETTRIGLAVSKPTTYSEPFTVSRELATLDFVSNGRAAWEATTNASDAEAQNFGRHRAPPADERRSIAAEYIEVSRKLWDSWEDDAVITDRARGLYLDPNKLHHINHLGKHFRIRGPQITYRPPQGHVVVVQVDRGDAGEPLSATLADVLVLHHSTLDAARAAYAEYQAEADAAGRQVRILQAILPILGATAAQAAARAAALDAALDIAGDGSALPPRATRLVGTPAQLADTLEQWFDARAADGFHLLPAVLPDGLEEIARELVPELQRRGRFRTAYTGHTLRDHLRLARPLSQYIGAESEAFTAYDRN
jgi:alkanesulfonate monooxygenase SsuD/methylene tetrahydromethanopterin reductase-like flavin-dependent oxidoreductase (luciferase family)